MVQAGDDLRPPVAFAGSLDAMGMNKSEWQEMTKAVLGQPSVSLLHIAVLDKNPRDDRNDIFKGPHKRLIWRGSVEEEQGEGDEELQAVIEATEDKRGFRALVLKFFPLYEDDADDSTWHRISKRLRPFVDKLLRLGLAHLWGLRLDADILAYPELLGQLPLRHLELEVGRSSKARLSEIMSALSQCSTLEHLSIQRPKTDCSPRPLGLHDLCLCKAPKLTLVHLQRCFPEGNFSLPAGCQLRLHLKDSPDSWDQTLQSENGKRLMECTSTLSLYYLSYHRPLPSHIQDFRALQYLKLEGSPQPKDLAILQGIPHVRVRVHGSLDTLFLTAGSWQSLEVYVYGGFEINFTDIDAFVRDNRRYLFVTSKATKAWRNMSTAMHAASQRQCVGYFTYKSADGTFHKRLSSIKGIAKDLFAHAISFDDFWPKVDMQSCLPSPTPKPIDKESALGKDLPKLQIAKNGRPPGHLTLRGSLAWLANRLKPIRNCIRCGKCVVVVAPEEAS